MIKTNNPLRVLECWIGFILFGIIAGIKLFYERKSSYLLIQYGIASYTVSQTLFFILIFCAIGCLLGFIVYKLRFRLFVIEEKLKVNEKIGDKI
jgi:uncharacterized protein HemY